MRILATLALLSLGGCGSIHNLTTGPQLYGGVRQDVEWGGTRCMGSARHIAHFDLPFSAVLDTGLLPVTLMFEGIRCATDWPPKGIR